MTSRERHINILKYAASLIRSDAEIHERELAFYLEMANAMQIPKMEARAIFLADTLNLDIPIGEHDRMEIFVYIVFVLLTDGVMTEEEVELAHSMVMRLGLRKELLSNVLYAFQHSDRKDIKTDLILEEAKKYLN